MQLVFEICSKCNKFIRESTYAYSTYDSNVMTPLYAGDPRIIWRTKLLNKWVCSDCMYGNKSKAPPPSS